MIKIKSREIALIRWCAYCQQFLGEIPPYSNLEATHGMCKKCVARGLDLGKEELEKLQEIAEMQRKFWDAGVLGDVQEVEILISHGLQMGLRPIDMLLGFVRGLH